MLDLLKRGSAAGFAAGVVVAAGVLIYDVFRLEPFATPDALARGLLGGPAVSASQLGMLEWTANFLTRATGLVGFTLVHFATFVLLGLAGVWTFRIRQAPANILTGALFGLVLGSGVFYLGFGLLAPSFVDIPSWQLVLAMNAIAGIIIVSQLADEEPEKAEAARA